MGAITIVPESYILKFLSLGSLILIVGYGLSIGLGYQIQSTADIGAMPDHIKYMSSKRDCLAILRLSPLVPFYH